MALTALGHVYARRGNPEAAAALDEALALADRNGQLMRLGPVRAARAEAALLAGDRQRARAEALAVRELVFAAGNRWQRGEFAWLLWQAGDRDVPTDNLAEPYALLIAGDWAGAAAAWHALGCPYEEACALAESDDPAMVRRAIAIFEELGAKPAHRARDRSPARAWRPSTCPRSGAAHGHDPRQSGGLDPARSGGPGPCRRGPAQRRDCRAALS